MRPRRLRLLGQALRGAAVFAFWAVFSSVALAQNPVPFVNLPLVPDAAAPGGPEFTLTVNGTGFVSGAVVDWNGSPLATHFVSGSQLTATIPAADIAAPKTASVTVVNPAPNGGRSNVAFFSVTSRTSSVAFVLASSMATGANPTAVAAGDFNGDGKLDLAVVSQGDDTVSIFLGDGTGSFTMASTLATGSSPLGVAVGDFDGDGKLDLAVINFFDNTTSVFLGDGTGNFTLASSPAVGVMPVSIAVGDFNEDGKLDLAVTNWCGNDPSCPNTGPGSVSTLLGDGSGNFTLVSSPATDINPDWVAVGDFNGDGYLDLAVVNFTGDYPVGAGSLDILLGDGRGGFTLGSSQSTQDGLGIFPAAVTAGDFNGDGVLDLAVANSMGNSLTVLMGDGTGRFTVSGVPAGNGPSSVPLGDFNGDGKLDVAVSDADAVYVMLGDGLGNFSVATHPSTGSEPGSVAIGDFNGDGRLDLAVSNSDGTVSILLQVQSGVTLSPSSLSFGEQQVSTTTSSPQTVTLTNTGNGSLNITNIAASGDFAQTNTCGSTVAAGASCTISVTFTPTATGTRSGAITITDDAAGSPQTVSLTGLGIVSGVSATLSTTSLTFPDQVVETTSAPQAVILTNTGTASLNITSIVSSGDFAETNTCGNSLASGASCSVNVTFTPTQAGTRTGSVTITDNAANSPQSILLTGQGTTAQTYDAAADFEQGWTSHSNPNGVWSYGYSNGFTGPVTLYDQTVEPNLDGIGQLWLSSSVNILESPAADFNDGSAFDDGNISFLANEFVLVAGVGGQYSDLVFTAPADGLYSVSSEFRGAQYYIGTVVGVVTNGQVLFSSSVTTVGQLVPFNTAVSLKAGNTLVFSVGPGGGLQNTGLSVTITGPTSAATVFPTSLSFANQVMQTRSAPQAVTLINPGTATIDITGIAASGDFAQTNTCGNSLASGASCTVSVTFTPTQAGTRTGSVTITDTAPDSPQSVTLTGQGITAAQNTLSFGYYRFENGTPGQVASGSGSILDSSPYQNNGTPVGAPTYSSDVPPVGIPNSVSLQFNGGYSDAVTFDKTFPFNQQGLDVSLDFWLKSPMEQYQEVLWTRLGSSDTNRFNLALNSNGTLALDYRDPDGNLHPLVGEVGSGVPVPADTWTHLNITRLGNEYFVLENGELMATATDSSPNLPTNVGWAIAGRSGYSFQGFLDEVQVSPALSSIVLTENTFDFGGLLVGTTSAKQSVTLTNLGSTPASITSIAASGDFAETNTCGNSLASGANCTISITFTPTAVGTRAGSITINDTASGSPQIVQLTGEGREVGLAPTSLTFAGQNVGTTSAGQFVTLTNQGNTEISLTSVTATGDFETTVPCTSLPPQGSCKILVIFRPTQTGPRTGMLTINDSERGQSTVNLSGTGTAPSVSLSTGSLTFAGQVVNTSSAAQSVTLTNTGSGPLTITSVTTSGDYAATPGHCAGTIAAGASCAIAVVFKPLLAGNRTGSLSIADNASGSPQTVALSGTGEDFVLSARTMSASVTAGQTASYTLSLASEDGFSGTVTLTCTGAPAAAACSLSPSAVTLAASDATLITVGVTTTARSTSPPAGRHRLPGPRSRGVWLLLTLLITLAMSVWTWRRSAVPRRALLWVPLGAALLLVALWAGCGSSGGGTTLQPRVTGTPAGTYSLTVAATDSGLTANVALTLVVN